MANPAAVAPVGAPFVIDPVLTAIAIAYRNPKLIADLVSPRVTVGRSIFRYTIYPKGEAFTVPDTHVSRKARPNQVEVTSTSMQGHTEDFALDDPVPQEDIDNAGPNQDPLGRATLRVSDLIELDREIRIATMIFDASQYATGNKISLSGTSQWSDYTTGVSDPVKDIRVAMSACVMRPNIMVIGRPAYDVMSSHPKILKAVFRNLGDSGIARKQDVIDLFQLDDIIIGEGWINTAHKGQTPILSRVWGGSAALIYQDKTADTDGGTTFSYTAQFKTRVAGTIPDANMGAYGGQWVRAAESVKEIICAADLGYLIEDCVTYP